VEIEKSAANKRTKKVIEHNPYETERTRNMVYSSSLGQRSFPTLRLQHIRTNIVIQTKMIATVMTEAKMCRPLLLKILPITLVAVT
jgi:hypothetical protein